MLLLLHNVYITIWLQYFWKQGKFKPKFHCNVNIMMFYNLLNLHVSYVYNWTTVEYYYSDGRL